MKSSSRVSSSSSSYSLDGEKETKVCYCKAISSMETARTVENYGRRFFSCPNYRTTAKCRFFEWKDEPFPPQAQLVIRKLLLENDVSKEDVTNVDQEKLRKLEFKLREKKMTLKEREKKLNVNESIIRDRERELLRLEAHLRKIEEDVKGKQGSGIMQKFVFMIFVVVIFFSFFSLKS